MKEIIEGMPRSDFYIVSWSSLLYLLRICLLCGEKAFITNVTKTLSVLIVNLLCRKNRESKWCSLQSLNGITKGNLILSATVLSPISISDVNFISKTTNYQLQLHFLFPTVHKVLFDIPTFCVIGHIWCCQFNWEGWK